MNKCYQWYRVGPGTSNDPGFDPGVIQTPDQGRPRTPLLRP